MDQVDGSNGGRRNDVVSTPRLYWRKIGGERTAGYSSTGWSIAKDVPLKSPPVPCTERGEQYPVYYLDILLCKMYIYDERFRGHTEISNPFASFR